MNRNANDKPPAAEEKDAEDSWLDPATSAGYLVRDTHLAFAKSLRGRLQQYDMTTGQYFFLRALWIEEGLSQRELSRRVGTTEPTTASAMRVLDKKGLVRRKRNEDDRRTVNIHLTDAGRRLKNQLLAHARELTWFFAPNVNSYKRFLPGTFAPTSVAWSYDNRTAGFRIVGRGPSLRVECRIPGADANPYLAYAALLAAGLDGIERKLEPGPAFVGDAYAARELPQVPRFLREAIDLLDQSRFARDAFGDAVIDHLLHFARTEQEVFDGLVSDVERARYFERI